MEQGEPQALPTIVLLTLGMPAPWELSGILENGFPNEVVGHAGKERFSKEHPPPRAVILSLDKGHDLDLLVRRLGELEWDCPILGVTREPSPELLLDWLRRGISGYLVYPYNDRQILDMMRSMTFGPMGHASMQVFNPLQGWVELSAPSKSEYLDRFRRFFSAINGTRLDDAAQRQILMAVYELGQNAIEWGNRGDESRIFKLSYCVFENSLVFKLADEGDGFDTTGLSQEHSDLLELQRRRKQEGKRPGGMGLMMARKVMDQVYYNDRGNVVIFEKSIPVGP
jgi:anti-sigma regulatory factor (Ser/Thr protein kinase)